MTKKPNISDNQVKVTDKKTGKTTFSNGLEKKKKSTVNNKIHNTKINAIASEIRAELPASPNTKSDAQIKPDKYKIQETIEQFIEGFYAGKTKSLSIDRVRKFKKQSFEIDLRENLVILAAKNDLTLEKSKNLLIFSKELNSYPFFQRTLNEFIRDAVMRHPIMVSNSAQLWFPLSGGQDEANLCDLFATIGALKQSPQEVKLKKEDLNNGDIKAVSELQKARLNAFYIALVWRYLNRYLVFAEFIKVLRATVYKLRDTQGLESTAFDFLIAGQGKEVTNIASLLHWHFDQGEGDRKAAEIAWLKAEELSGQLVKKNGLLVSANSEIQDLNEQIKELRKKLDEASEKERVLGIQTRDEKQKQRGRTLRILEGEIPLLADCLTALDRDPPKVEIAKEYIDLVLQKLSKELVEIKGAE
jgi:hypothetical protein